MKRNLLISLLSSITIGAMMPLPAFAIMPGGSTIYAGLWTTSESNPEYGIYSLDPENTQLALADPKGSMFGYPLRNAWIADGKLCGYYVRESYSIVEDMYYIELNQEGEVEKFEELSCDSGYMFAAAYNPDDNYIYGYGLNGDYSYALMRAPASDPGAFQNVREFDYTADEECLSIAYNTIDQKLYGINVKGKFVRIDTNTGIQTTVSNAPGGAQSLLAGMCFSPKENLFYWNPQFSSGSAIYTISADGRQYAKVYDCPNDEQYNFLVCPDKYTVATSPLAPEIKEIDFGKGALSGTIRVQLPTLSVDNEQLTGSLALEVLLDGEGIATMQGNPGEELTASYNALSEGNHIFSFKAFNGEAPSELASRTMWVGIDTPMAVESVTLTNKLVKWTRVTEGVNGGYVDAENLEYFVYLNDDLAFTQAAGNLWGFHQLANAELKRYTASVVVKAGGKVSETAYSNELALGTPLQPGLALEPTREDVEKMSVIDVNADGRTWSYSLYQECAKSSFGSGVAMDDWLILSPVEFAANIEYILGIDVQSCNSSYTEEYLGVYIGDSPDPQSMTTALIPVFNPQRQKERHSARFTLPAHGVYYIGFHTASAPDQEGILLSNITLKPFDELAVESVEGPDSAAIYYNLQGVRIQTPGQGICIEYKDGKARKVHLSK